MTSDPKTWTIREAHKQVFSRPPIVIPVPTIQTWASRGVFEPYQQATPRDPRGSRLDFTDLVMLSLLHTFFSLGLKMGPIAASRFSSVATRTFRVPLASLMVDSENLVTVLIPTYTNSGPLPTEALARLQNAVESKQRPVQQTLTIFDSKLVAEIYFVPSVRPMYTIRFVPTPVRPGPSSATRFAGLGPSAVITIDVRAYAYYVNKRLRGS